MIAVKRPADKILGQYGFALAFQLSRERSKKTEAVFLVGSRGSGGEIEIPPGSFSFASVFFCQRFLLEKQKKMLDRTCKFAAVSRILFQKLRLSF